MKSITYIWDRCPSILHATYYTLRYYSVEDYQAILKKVNQIKSQQNPELRCCVYEAGYLGYSPYNQLTYHGIGCVTLTPTTILIMSRKKKRLNAKQTSKCLMYHTYSALYIPTEEDITVKEYIRM